jgi:RNA recognition motif-containing protein
MFMKKMREKERLERERGGERSRRGYIHNVDQSSVSFFITNFPEDCHTEDLWKVFGRFGRLGDVYIPNKVDKWVKRFAFVKFREVRDVEELSGRMEVVWFGSFKLRVNQARFSRKKDDVKKELEESFVGKLAGNIEVCRIRTILFIEGFAHISVTDMGRNMVLIHSPKVGEVERLWKTRADWMA